MCWTPPYVNKNKSHGTQNVKTNRTNTICVGHLHACRRRQTKHNMCWTPSTRRRHLTKHNMCWTPLYVNKTQHEDKQNTYVLDNTICVGHEDKQNTNHTELRRRRQTKHNMCWTPLYVNKNKSHGTQTKTLNKTQYVLDTSYSQDEDKQNTICVGHLHTQDEDKQNTICVGHPERTKTNKTQYVLDTPMHVDEDKQNTLCVGHLQNTRHLRGQNTICVGHPHTQDEDKQRNVLDT